jgi:hypothetical protein
MHRVVNLKVDPNYNDLWLDFMFHIFFVFLNCFPAIIAIFFTYADIMDSSGIEFIYENAPRRYDAGILLMGHQVNPLMIVPPRATDYGVTGVCSSECTSRVSILSGYLRTCIVHNYYNNMLIISDYGSY